MRSTVVIALVAVLSCGHAALAQAEEQPPGPSAADPVAALTPQQFEALRCKWCGEERYPGDIAAWPVHAGDESCFCGVRTNDEHNRNRRG